MSHGANDDDNEENEQEGQTQIIRNNESRSTRIFVILFENEKNILTNLPHTKLFNT